MTLLDSILTPNSSRAAAKTLLLLAIAVAAHAQSGATAYVRASGPASITVIGATNATPIVITTNGAHGFASTCGISGAPCYCGVWGVATGTGVSPADGVFQCHYVSGTQLALYDKVANLPIAGTGSYFNGVGNAEGLQFSAAWVSQLTPYTLGSEPLGYFDGPSGILMRRLSLGPQNGMAASAGLVVSGGFGGSCTSTPCTVEVATTYNPLTGQGVFPIAAGINFSVTGTGTALDTCGDGTKSPGAQSPYTMASVSSTGWVSNGFTCAGLTTGDKTSVNMKCGPASTPNDTIGGTQSCTRVSQMAHTANAWWTGMEAAQTDLGGSDLTQSTYKTTWDGGLTAPQGALLAAYSMGAIRFLVDPSSAFWLGQCIYALNYVQRVSGVNFTWNEAADTAAPNFFQKNTDWEGLAILYAAAVPYWASSERAVFLNKIYNDLDDPTATVYSGGSSTCNKTNAVLGGAGVDESTTVNHNWLLSSGLAQTGTNDSTHVTLASPAHCVVGSEIQLANGSGYNSNSYGWVTSCSGAVATVSGWVTGNGNTGTPPSLNNLLSGTYTGGLSGATGSAGQSCWLGFGSYFQAYITLTGTNSLPTSQALTIIARNNTFGSAPTTSTVVGGSAACTGTANVSVTLGTAYTVFDTFVLGSTSNGVTTIATFGSTPLAGSINVGDAVIGMNGWGSEVGVQSVESYVVAVGPGSSSCGTLTAKQLCVINGGGISPSLSSTPAMAWRVPQWTTYDCGFRWGWKHNGVGSLGVTTSVYPGGGGGNGGLAGPTQTISEGGNLGAGDPMDFAALDLAAANDDSRAARDLSLTQSWSFDYEWRHYMDYSGGWFHSGASYSLITQGGMELDNWLMTQSVPTYPNLDLTGAWMQGEATQKIYGTYPDQYGASQVNLLVWGGGNTYGVAPNETPMEGFPFDPAFLRAPQSNNAGYLRNWMEHATPYFSLWGNQTSSNVTFPERYGLAFLHNDPRIADVDYTTQPTQHVWNTSSSATCASVTGWPCYQFRGDMMISRGPWKSGSSLNLPASLLFTEFQTYTSDYDDPSPGDIRLYKAGPLLGPDSNPVGQGFGDSSIQADSLQFGGAQSSYLTEFANGLANNQNNVGKITISNWGGQANSGSWSTAYGDSQSRYAYVCGNVAPAYNTSRLGIAVPYANRCVYHSKPSGGDEFIFQLDDVSIGSAAPTQLATHIHYPQTGQSLNTATYPMGTGKTICVNSSYSQVACSALNSNRLIEEVEDAGEYAGNPPARNYGLMTWIASPGTIYVNWDIPGTYTAGNQPQATPSNTYSGGQGWTNRVTVAAGSSLGASVSGEHTWLIVHKVMQSLTDTAIQPTALNPGSTWTGAQVCGSTSCAVGIFALGNATQSTVPIFTTTHTGTAQYLIGGLTAGSYTVKVNGTAVPGSPFPVPANDNSLEFASTAGAVSITSGAAPNPAASTIVSGRTAVSGTAVIH
jgi:hypothetical protein